MIKVGGEFRVCASSTALLLLLASRAKPSSLGCCLYLSCFSDIPTDCNFFVPFILFGWQNAN
ncbi:hypothetical protein [Microseira wollei]|uniref:hypothetical protein n=1 Tax=Microseira wollei TaxID=467598 RepID=UPI001CFCB5D6|nr:hypothetical protein [Microseira wollei]